MIGLGTLCLDSDATSLSPHGNTRLIGAGVAPNHGCGRLGTVVVRGHTVAVLYVLGHAVAVGTLAGTVNVVATFATIQIVRASVSRRNVSRVSISRSACHSDNLSCLCRSTDGLHILSCLGGSKSDPNDLASRTGGSRGDADSLMSLNRGSYFRPLLAVNLRSAMRRLIL